MKELKKTKPETGKAKDWVEDFQEENGYYQNKCKECEDLFVGYKRRLFCKVCYIKLLEQQVERLTARLCRR